MNRWTNGSDRLLDLGMGRNLIRNVYKSTCPMSFSVLITLLFYLGGLAVTQTAYGWRFMATRWVALTVFFGVSGLVWIHSHAYNRILHRDAGLGVVLAYLSCTLLSVFNAENFTFSGLRWGVHAMMLLAFMVFLRETLTVKDVNRIALFLKVITLGLLVLSYIKPAPLTVYDDARIYRGAMGNANTLGHIAALGALLFFHGVLSSKNPLGRIVQAISGVYALATLWATGARSSLVFLLAGVTLICIFYGVLRLPVIIALGIILLTIMSFTSRLEESALQFVFKQQTQSAGGLVDKVFETRLPIWSRSWNSFLERPILGWGFGAASSIKRDWVIRPYAIGAHKRDDTNDILFILEGSGLIGFGGYLALVGLLFSQSPPRRQLRVFRTNGIGMNSEITMRYHLHALMYILSVSLVVLFMWDCSAFSAGSFPAAVLWLCASCAGALARSQRSTMLAHDVWRMQGVAMPS